jgi:hypothetical protein
MERPSHYIECAPRSREKDLPRGIALRDGAQRVSERKNFCAAGKIFGKTCCIKPTNSYNYQQVIAVFACFTCNRSLQGFDSGCQLKRESTGAASEGSWFNRGEYRL